MAAVLQTEKDYSRDAQIEEIKSRLDYFTTHAGDGDLILMGRLLGRYKSARPRGDFALTGLFCDFFLIGHDLSTGDNLREQIDASIQSEAPKHGRKTH